jgi:hypothetical protein
MPNSKFQIKPANIYVVKKFFLNLGKQILIYFQDCKPDIVAATAACEEVKKSKKFAKILELILLIGNIMNTGTKNAQSVGFDISYLPKVNLNFNKLKLN